MTLPRVYVSHMSPSRAFRGALTCAALLGCGERAADPIVASPSTRSEAGQNGGLGGSGGGPPVSGSSGAGPSGGTGGTDQPPLGGDAAGGEAPTPETGPTGLCGPCTSSDACGDANDACVRHQSQNFCGRDCDDQRGCPDGYSCVELANSQLFQCVPDTACPTPAPAPTLDELRPYVLSVINSERAAYDRVALAPSRCLDDLAQASALEFARSDEPLGKYVKECDPVWPNCDCGWNAEGEIAIARYDLDWMTAIERSVGPARDTQNRFSQGLLATDVTDIGIGFWISGDEAWLALSYR